MNLIAFQEVLELHQRCSELLDSNDFSAWPDLFVHEGIYKIQSRENFDAGLPLCILSFESQGMLRDRVYGAQQTIYHDPYYQRHIVGAPRIIREEGNEIEAETSYLVIRTKRDAMPEILSVGRYIDRMRRTPEGLRFASRICVFDNDLVANSIIKPI
jgi:salicylate 5-hydroxylase small subunit